MALNDFIFSSVVILKTWPSFLLCQRMFISYLSQYSFFIALAVDFVASAVLDSKSESLFESHTENKVSTQEQLTQLEINEQINIT